MNQEELSGALEAALFAVGEPLDVNRICSAFKITQIELSMAVDALQAKYGENSGYACFISAAACKCVQMRNIKLS